VQAALIVWRPRLSCGTPFISSSRSEPSPTRSLARRPPTQACGARSSEPQNGACSGWNSRNCAIAGRAKRRSSGGASFLGIQHIPKLPYERQHRILLPLLEQILKNLQAGGLEGAASTFTPDKLILDGAREFAIGGPEGDNGLSGKKLVIDHYGPGVPIGGGALCGKDPHKVDKCGALRAYQLAKKLVRKCVDEARVILGWAPGGDAPFLIEASTTQGGVSLQVPRQELPSDEWFSIKAIVRDLELTERDWAADLLAGYFCRASAPWEAGDPLKKSFYSPRLRRSRAVRPTSFRKQCEIFTRANPY
jgi:S-adenosylmethionine synthetase family protein